MKESKPKTKLVAKIVCASDKGSRWYNNRIGEEFDIAINARSGYHDKVLVTTTPDSYSFYVSKCDCVVYEKEIEPVKEQKKDNTNKTYFEKQVELYLNDLGGNPFGSADVSKCLKILQVNHNSKFKNKIVEIKCPSGFGDSFKVLVSNVTGEQVEFLEKLIIASLRYKELVRVVEFVEHPFSKSI